MSEINVTPMVDVMLVLLVIFMVTAPWLGRALHLDLPRAQASSPAQTGAALDIGLKADGTLWLNSEVVTWKDLPGRLQALGRESQGEPPAVRLAADATVNYEQIVRVMDVLHQNGLAQIGFMTSPMQKP
jgi:biopolymer transport protein ExbD